jgi:Protein of unknown function (DUF4231)
MQSPPQSLTAEVYIKERLDQYKDWYDRKDVKMKALYLRMRASSVIGGALVPVLINMQVGWTYRGIDLIKMTVTIISLIVVVFVSLESVFHYREQWKNYRSTEQLLGHEKFLFLSRVGHYSDLDDGTAFRLLVERIEDAITIENSATLNVMTMAAETTATAKKGSEV